MGFNSTSGQVCSTSLKENARHSVINWLIGIARWDPVTGIRAMKRKWGQTAAFVFHNL